MGSMPEHRGLEKVYFDISSQKLRNQRGMIFISAHLEAEKLEEQRHNAQLARTLLLHTFALATL
jgi:hypothetical protein